MLSNFLSMKFGPGCCWPKKQTQKTLLNAVDDFLSVQAQVQMMSSLNKHTQKTKTSF